MTVLFPCHVLLEKTAVFVPGVRNCWHSGEKEQQDLTANSPSLLEQSLGVTVLGGSSYNVLVCLNSACLFRRLNSFQPLFPEARDTFYKVSGSFSLLNIKQSLTK